MSFRIAGGKLIFLDIYQDGYMVQGICSQGDLDAFGGTTKKQFKDFWHRLQRGDFICWFMNLPSCLSLISSSPVWQPSRN
jgi:lysyl-tRNA synthetase class II